MGFTAASQPEKSARKRDTKIAAHRASRARSNDSSKRNLGGRENHFETVHTTEGHEAQNGVHPEEGRMQP